MKTLGIIGGLSWHSTAIYYKMLNQFIHMELGGDNAARLLIHSINYNDFKQLQEKNDWGEIEKMLSSIAIKLQNAGADCLMISCNAAHLVADRLTKKIDIPFLHIADATAAEIEKYKLTKVALTGTKFTMENTFFSEKLRAKGIETIIPEPDERECIHRFILNELAKGEIKPATKRKFIEIVNALYERGAQAIILGCTELGMLLQQTDTQVQLFDTTLVHCRKAIQFSLSETE
jgi:aspartate racemase